MTGVATGRAATWRIAWASILLIVTAAACNGGDSPTAPTADAGADRTVEVGATVVLDASGSSAPDADGAPTFAWTLRSAPDGSAAALANANAAEASLVPDLAGDYVAEVEVSDGRSSASDTVTVTAVDPAEADLPPVADAGPGTTVEVGDTATLDGSASHDPNGDALTFSWSFVTWPGGPGGAAPTLAGAETDAATFVPVDAGDHTLELTVSDGGAADTDRVTVRAVSDAPTVAVFVDPAGDDTDPGTEALPVRSLSRALQVTAEEGLREIRLAPGVYAEEAFDYVLDASVRITGAGMDVTELDAGDANLFTLQAADGADDPVALYLQDVTVTTTGTAVSVPPDTEAHLLRVTCAGASPCVRAAELLGFLPGPGGTFTFRSGAAVAEGSGTAFSVAGSAHLIEASRIEGYGTGVYAFGSAFRLEGVTLDGNAVGLQALGSIDVDGDGDVDPLVARGSTFVSNGTGIVARGAHLRVTDSVIEGSGAHGLHVEASGTDSEVTLVDVTWRQNGASGLRADGGRVEVRRGLFESNGTDAGAGVDRAGIHVGGTARLTAIGTTTRDNGGHGVAVHDDASADLRTLVSDAARGFGAGVLATTTGTLTIEGATLTDNRYGVYADGATDAAITSATVDDNGYAGISFRGTGELYLRDAVLRRNGIANVQLRGEPARVDLGTDVDPGGNLLRSAEASTWNLADERPDRANPDGTVVDLHGVRFFASPATEASFTGTRTGPAFSAPHWTVDGANQRIRF